MEEWLSRQSESVVSTWEKSIERFYPQHAPTWNDPDQHYEALTQEWHSFDATRYLNWEQLLSGHHLKILDMGAGTGWLSAFLSKLDQVEQIDALDSSRNNLNKMMPRLIQIMGGDASKIRPIRGLFSPILVEDAHYDYIVASSAVHHAPSLSEVLRECHRVLKSGGKLVILNETPMTLPRYIYRSCRIFASVILGAAAGKMDEPAASISSSGILYDPFLGDRAYLLPQWRETIQKSGFNCEVIRTPFSPYQNKKQRSIKLTHFICTKI